MRKVEDGFRSLAPASPRERRRNVRALLVFALAYGLVCGLVAAPKGYFVPGTDIAAVRHVTR